MKNRTGQAGNAAVQRRLARSSLVLTLISPLIIAGATSLSPASVTTAYAQPRTIELGGKKKTTSITIPIGKSEDVRTDAPFMEVMVGDPEIADVSPLTDRSISVLGKKIGTTRVSIYSEGKNVIGIFDVEVSYDVSKLSSEINRQFPRARIRVSSVNGRILLSGTSPDAVTLDRVVAIAKQFGPDIINSVGVTQPQQVMLEVRFVEASRTAARELGVNWKILGNSASVVTGTGGLLSNSTPFGTIMATLLGKGIQADPLIQALEDRGVARRLAEPNLVALSGDTASFLAGGEFPFPVQGALNQISIEFKKFGVGLAFTPTVLSNGLINLKIEPEVSQIDPTNTFSFQGVQVPGLIVRRSSTTIELHDGQSFAIAGMLQADSLTSAKQLPWIGDVPILGALFRSADYQKRETELAIIVTPRLVQPDRPVEMVKTPLDGTLPANDADFFLLGKHEVTSEQARAIDGGDQQDSDAGYFLDLPQLGGAHVALR